MSSAAESAGGQGSDCQPDTHTESFNGERCRQECAVRVLTRDDVAGAYGKRAEVHWCPHIVCAKLPQFVLQQEWNQCCLTHEFFLSRAHASHLSMPTYRQFDAHASHFQVIAK